jgi:carbamoyl-phosphate synthase large subunit
VKKILLLGSGGLRIGQAGEFDYSGSQAIKAIKEGRIEVVLINPNIATVQTDMADRVYLQPLELQSVKKIIARERPDAILLGFGGQTALNLGLELEAEGVLEDFGVEVLGTSVKSIRIAEDRALFKAALDEIGVKTARSFAANSLEEAEEVVKAIGFPAMVRSGYSLGGLSSGRVGNLAELRSLAKEALSAAPQILIEEYLQGWKEVEYEIVRDRAGNCAAICNMENFDPMGIHTGESIVVAPSQTLNNEVYHRLRTVALQVASHLEIIGECNVQYAVHPETGDYRVIELNPRLSRSSALASKATGYPLAYIATKLALGARLDELKNQVTGKTCAFFEPALDYIVVKMPRWDTHKLKAADRRIGTEMKSVGEVMAIGRSFPEALQKAIRMCASGSAGLCDHVHTFDDPLVEIERATDRRLFAIGDAMQKGHTVEELHQLSGITPYFLEQLQSIVQMHQQPGSMLQAKRWGFSDGSIAKWHGTSEEEVRSLRLSKGIRPVVKQIDTMAGECEAETNYLYTTYWGSEHDVEPASQTLVLGSGPYCIGSSVEFDWCAVNALQTFRREGVPAAIINCNPETVSTDYDESDRLYFEELTLERVRDIADFESTPGIVVSVGGQIPNSLALPLENAGYPILGTPARCIDKAENRKTFSTLLNDLEIDQPAWREVTTLEKARQFAAEVGYPLLVRPSYVLSGAAMNVIFNDLELERYLQEATLISRDHPVVISQFITDAKEIEVDGVADGGEIVIFAIAEHVENAGVHSGDATLVIPPQRLYLETIRRARKVARAIVKALEITGPFNLQLLAKDQQIKVIECNVRAARSFPFVSKVCKHNLISIATEVLLGRHTPVPFETLDLDHVGVKSPQFSYRRLKGANPVAHVEMASTGEVACLGDDFLEAFYRSWLATDQSIRSKRLLVSIGGDRKPRLLEELQALEQQGWEIYATDGTQRFLARNGVGARFVHKESEETSPCVSDLISEQHVDLIINIPRRSSPRAHTDGYRIRRQAIDHSIPLITNLQLAKTFLDCLLRPNLLDKEMRAWQEYVV